MGQGLAAVIGDHNRVLDANAAVSCQVHTRLDGDHRAGGERSIGARCDPRCLVNVEAHAVPGAIGEPLGEAVGQLLDNPVRYLGARGAGAGPHGHDLMLLALMRMAANDPDYTTWADDETSPLARLS